MSLPKTITEVIHELDHIIEENRQKANNLGLFAALYRRVTIAVKQGIENGRFEDGPRMEKLDVVFANRYIHAYRQYSEDIRPTESWAFTFEQAENKQLTILQHLLLGMNAHINLDLGIAAAEISEGHSIQDIKNDFETINTLLFEMIEAVQSDISKVSPLFKWIDWLAKSKDEQLAKFSMKKARQHAWIVAQRIAVVKPELKNKNIQSTDKYVKELAVVLAKPGAWVSFIYKLIRWFESKNVTKNIAALY